MDNLAANPKLPPTNGITLMESSCGDANTNQSQSSSTCGSNHHPQSPPLCDGNINKSCIDPLLINEEGPVPNFRLEGTGAGDASVTVAVASLTTSSAVLLREEEDQCESQSSEDMKLSLVSWYSEPDDPLRLISSSSSCCEGGVGASGRQAISMTGSLMGMAKSGSEEKENQTPEPLLLLQSLPQEDLANSRESVLTLQEEECKNNANNKQRIKVQLQEQKNTTANNNMCKRQGICDTKGKPECLRCTRRSKSGTNTPATISYLSRTRTPANRRVMSCTKSSTEVKKPIKSILKDSRSGSGSDNKSTNSMDSLGSGADITPLRRTPMTRSDSGNTTDRAKFHRNHHTTFITTPVSCPQGEDRLRGIEKYATLRLRSKGKGRVLDLGSDGDLHGMTPSSGGKVTATPYTDIMTKSMSFLEKSHVSLPNPNPNTNSLKRQGSLRLRKGTSPHWEPCTTRTTALRMQKMQEAKVKAKGGGASGGGGSGGGGLYSAGSGSVHTASIHSGSGESIHHVAPHHGHGHSHGHHHPSAPTNKTPSTPFASKEKSVKVFAKLSSAFGQTASSNQKRLKQEKSVQTDALLATMTNSMDSFPRGASSMSPIPCVDATADLLEQIRQLEKLANRYRNTALRFQSEFEKSEAKTKELSKQLKETQAESGDLIDFLQAEKSTLAETLAEIETEAKKWREQIDTVKRDSDARTSCVVRLSEQNKQEALKSQTLLNRLESQSNAMLSSFTNQIAEGTSSIQMTKEKVNSLTECLLKTYKIPQELLSSFAEQDAQSGSETKLNNSSLLVPLISSLAKSFPSPSAAHLIKKDFDDKPKTPVDTNNKRKVKFLPSVKLSSASAQTEEDDESNSSLRNLNQAILDREAAEDIGLDQITLSNADHSIMALEDDTNIHLHNEISELNLAIGRLLLVVRVIVVQCDKRVSTVASSILQCLQSMEDDKVGTIPEIAQVQKSLEAWRDSSQSSHNGTLKDNEKTTASVENGHSKNLA